MKHMGFSRRAKWIGRKLASKDAAYSLRRVSYPLRKGWVDRRFPAPRHMKGARFDPSASGGEDSGLLSLFQRRMMPRWHFEASRTEAIVASIPAADRERTVGKAMEVMDHRFTVMGLEPYKLHPIDWDHSPDGDVAWTRELNRHACLEELGFAYGYTCDERFAQAFVELSGSWMDQVAGRIGRLEWDNPFQVARRINSWIWSFFLFLGSPTWEGRDQRRFLSTLGLLTEYLYQTIEYHSPGNHVLLEAKALALCGEVFPEFGGARQWRAKAWRILSRELEIQICEDGVHAERATMYHRIIAGELAELWQFCSRNELPQERELEHVVRRMAEFQRWIDLGSGRYPLFGDSRARDTYYRFSAPAIVAAESGTLLPLEEGVSDHTWWVREVMHGIPVDSPPEGAKAFPEGGYYVSRYRASSGPNVLVWDCGPVGYEANRKHAHADALSVVLSVEGEPLLVDPGMGGPGGAGFSPDLPWAIDGVERGIDLRRTRAHNTISVDGEDQAVLAERNEIWSPPEPEVVLWSSSDTHDVMWGRHDGYQRLGEPVVHERVIVSGRDGYWLILDRMSGIGVHTAEIRYHIASPATLEEFGPGRFRIGRSPAEVLLVLFGPRGGDAPIPVAREERIGEVHDGRPELIPVLCATYVGPVPLIMGTFVAVTAGAWSMRAVDIDGFECTVEVGNRKRSDRIVVRFGGDDNRPGVEIVQEDQQDELVHRWTCEPSRPLAIRGS